MYLNPNTSKKFSEYKFFFHSKVSSKYNFHAIHSSMQILSKFLDTSTSDYSLHLIG